VIDLNIKRFMASFLHCLHIKFNLNSFLLWFLQKIIQNSFLRRKDSVSQSHVYFIITVTSSHRSLYVFSHRTTCLSPTGPSSGSLLYISHYTCKYIALSLIKIVVKFSSYCNDLCVTIAYVQNFYRSDRELKCHSKREGNSLMWTR
jgi:hypothetical protein